MYFSNPKHWLRYFNCQNHDKVQHERSFSFNHIPCSFILPIICSATKSTHFPHVNTLSTCCNWIKPIVMIACMFLKTSLIVNRAWHALALSVSKQQCLISFEAAAHCNNLSFIFSTNDLRMGWVYVFYLWKLLRLTFSQVGKQNIAFFSLQWKWENIKAIALKCCPTDPKYMRTLAFEVRIKT